MCFANRSRRNLSRFDLLLCMALAFGVTAAGCSSGSDRVQPADQGKAQEDTKGRFDNSGDAPAPKNAPR